MPVGCCFITNMEMLTSMAGLHLMGAYLCMGNLLLKDPAANHLAKNNHCAYTVRTALLSINIWILVDEQQWALLA